MNKYQQFHRTKHEVINKLSSISEGSRMDGWSDNFTEDVTNSETWKEAFELMEQANKLVQELCAEERGNPF